MEDVRGVKNTTSESRICKTLPDEDFVSPDKSVLTALNGRRIFVTGGTGFIGSWVLEYLYRESRKHGLEVEVQLLSRDPRAFLRANPHLAGWRSLSMVCGDVRSIAASAVSADWVLHGATPASRMLNESNPLEMADIIVGGTRNSLEIARRCGAKRFLFLSSGLAYGSQPPELDALVEEQTGRLNSLDPKAAYGNAKHFAEHLCIQYGISFGFEVSIARLFAFLGPLLPLDAHFAAGNFIRDGLEGRTIRVEGDGTPLRTYLHAGELARWLWTLFARGRPGQIYNVGSDEIVSIRELAERVGRLCGVGVEIAGTPAPGRLPPRYVPDVRKAGQELGLRPLWNLEESLCRTLAWHRGRIEENPA